MMGRILVDSNVLLDVMTEDQNWFDWSSNTLQRHADEDILCINPVIYAEVSIRFESIEELEAALPVALIERLPIPYEAAFLAGKCFMNYRRRGGTRLSTLPDFFIGAHASVEGMPLVTRDAARYHTYFPKLRLIAPQ
jgi:predicted nucleic acid-binding protein